MEGTKILVLIYFFSIKSIDADFNCESEGFICSISGQNISATDPFIITSSNTSLLHTLIISDCYMPQASQTIFTKYPQVVWLTFANCSLQELTPSVFTNAIKMTNLLMMDGSIETLNNGTFIYCVQLESLQIVSHQVSTIDIMAFQGLKNLENLVLNDNFITYLHPLTLSVLPKLTNFDISNNLLTTIDSQQFIKNPHMYGVTLNGNQLASLPNDLFQAQKNLDTFFVSNNQLVTAQSYGVKYVDLSNNKLRNFTLTGGETTIKIENNVIRKIICSNIANLTVQTLYADNNLLSSFLCIRDMVNLTDLSINGNKMAKLTKKPFLKLINLECLSMTNMTRMNKVPAKIFTPLKSLAILRVDSLVSYKNLNTTFPNLYLIASSTKTWNCSYVSHINSILKSQNIIFIQNGEYDDRCGLQE